MLAYSQSNGQTEATNRVMVDGLKKRLDEAKGKLVNVLPFVLWVYRTTLRKSTCEASFSMMYGSEAVIPLEIGFPTMRSDHFDSVKNEQLLSRELDLIEQRREVATIKLAYYQ